MQEQAFGSADRLYFEVTSNAQASPQAVSWALPLSDALLRPRNMGEDHSPKKCTCVRGVGGLRVPQEERGAGDKEDSSRRQVVQGQGRVSVMT